MNDYHLKLKSWKSFLISKLKFSLLAIIIYLLYGYLFIDTLNGLIIRNYAFSFSPIYKMLLLVLMMYVLLKKKIYTPIILLSFFTMLILLHIVQGIYSSLELFWMLKFIMIVTSLYFFKFLISINKFHVVKNMFFISFIVISFNMFVGALGYGYAQYGRNDIGTRGLFYAGNEVGGLLIVTSIFILSYFLLRKEFYKYLSISLIILTLAVLLTSKVALFGSALIIFILPIINLISTRKGLILSRVSFRIVGISTMIFIFLVPYTVYYALYEMNLIVRISFWMNKVDFITLFYSGRNLLANDIFQFLQNQDISFNAFFGYGYEKIITVAGRSVELDAVDLFMLYGTIGVVVIYGFFLLNYFSNRVKKSKVYIYKPYVQFGILFLLLISISSGHIINSGVAGIMIGALMSLNYYKVGNK
jgi:hypothetical protein